MLCVTRDKRRIIALAVFVLALAAAVAGAAIAGAAVFSGQGRTEKALGQGDAALKERRYEQALTFYEEAMETGGAGADAFLGSAEAYMALEQYGDALRVLQRGMEENRNSKEELKALAEKLAQVCREGAARLEGDGARRLLEEGIDALDAYGLERIGHGLRDALEEENRGSGGDAERVP